MLHLFMNISWFPFMIFWELRKALDSKKTLFLAEEDDEATLLAPHWEEAYWESGEGILDHFTAHDWPDSCFQKLGHGQLTHTHTETSEDLVEHKSYQNLFLQSKMPNLKCNSCGIVNEMRSE